MSRGVLLTAVNRRRTPPAASGDLHRLKCIYKTPAFSTRISGTHTFSMFLITFFRPVHKYTYFQLNINNSVTSMAKTPSGRFCDLHVSFSKLSIYRPKSVFFANMDHMCCQRSLFGGVSKHLRFPIKLSHFYWRRIACHVFNFSSFFENVALVATRATFLRPRPFFVFVFELANMKIDLSLMVFDMF